MENTVSNTVMVVVSTQFSGRWTPVILESENGYKNWFGHRIPKVRVLSNANP